MDYGGADLEWEEADVDEQLLGSARLGREVVELGEELADGEAVEDLVQWDGSDVVLALGGVDQRKVAEAQIIAIGERFVMQFN